MKRIVLFCFLVIVPIYAFSQESKENADFKLALNLYNDKMFDLAAEQFQAFINIYPTTQQSADARFYLALSLSKLSKHEDARMAFQNFAISYPDHPRAAEAWMNVAEEYVAMNNLHDAAMAFERVKTFQPKSTYAPKALLRAETCYEQIHDQADALRVLRTLTQDYSSADVIPARLKYAELLLTNGQAIQAREESRRIAELSTENAMKARADVLAAQALIVLGKQNEADQIITACLKNYKSTASYAEALFLSGVLKNASGNTNDAMKVWGTVASDTIKSSVQLRQNALLEMAQAENRVRHFTKSLEYYERAASLNGAKSAEARYGAAVTAERIGEMNKASQYYLLAIDDTMLHAQRKAIYAGAMRTAYTVKNYSEGLRVVRLFQLQYPDDAQLPRFIYESARVMLNQVGDAKTAIAQCEYILDRFPVSEYHSDILYILACAKEKIGDHNGARLAFETLIQTYPCSDYTSDAKMHLQKMNLFDKTNHEEGIQKLALLIGDVIAQKGKGDLAYRLADIYYSDLRDYDLAAGQYQSALKSDLEEPLRPAAWMKAGLSNEYLAFREGISTEQGKIFIRKAISLYDSLLVHYPKEVSSEQAIIHGLLLRLQIEDSLHHIQLIDAECLSKYLSIPGIDTVLLEAGNSYFRNKDYADAVQRYKFLTDKYPGKTTAHTAQYYLAMSFNALANHDSAALVMKTFLDSQPQHPLSASGAMFLAQYYADSGHTSDAIKMYDMIEQRYAYAVKHADVPMHKADAFYGAHDYSHAYAGYSRIWDESQQDIFSLQGSSDHEQLLILRLADCADKIGDRVSAKKWFTEYILRDQSTERAVTAYKALAAYEKSENHLELAASYLDEANRIERSKGNQAEGTTVEAADLLFAGEKFAEALARYQTALQQTKNDTAVRYIQSQIILCYFRQDKLKEAEKKAADFKKAYSDKMAEAKFEFERGKYYLRNDDLERAQKYFENVVDDYSKSSLIPEVLLWIGRVCELKQKTDSAVIVYNTILEKFPNDPIIPRIRLNLGNAYYTLEKWDAASKQYRTLLDNEAKSPDLVQFAMSNLIMTYKEMELYDGALELTRKYIERFPDDTDLIEKKIDIGVLYQKLGYYDQSIVHLQHLLDAGNADLEAELRYYIGEAYYYKGDYQQAVLEFLKVPYLVAKHQKVDWVSTSYYMAGQADEKMSKYDQAMIMYKQIIDRKDTDVQFKTAAQKEIDRVKLILEKK